MGSDLSGLKGQIKQDTASDPEIRAPIEARRSGFDGEKETRSAAEEKPIA